MHNHHLSYNHCCDNDDFSWPRSSSSPSSTLSYLSSSLSRSSLKWSPWWSQVALTWQKQLPCRCSKSTHRQSSKSKEGTKLSIFQDGKTGKHVYVVSRISKSEEQVKLCRWFFFTRFLYPRKLIKELYKISKFDVTIVPELEIPLGGKYKKSFMQYELSHDFWFVTQ